MKKELQDLLKKLKENNKDVFVLTVGEEKQKLYGFFRKPTFNEFRMIYPLIVKGDDLMADKRLAETCWLGGDNELINIDNNLDLFLSYKADLSVLIDIKVSSIKKK